MRIIYEPSGRAAEYSDLALSMYRGCEHACSYCFGPSVIRVDRATFASASARAGALRKVERDAAELAEAGDERAIMMSFTTDPYQPLEMQIGLTRQALELLKKYGRHVEILTKGGLRAERDFDLLDDGDAVACSLTLAKAEESKEWEPYAALPEERMLLLKHAHERGFRTWVSIEPVIDPLQSIALIVASLPYVDTYKLGAWNYDKRSNDVDWPEYYRRARDVLAGEGKQVIIKADLLERAGVRNG